MSKGHNAGSFVAAQDGGCGSPLIPPSQVDLVFSIYSVWRSGGRWVVHQVLFLVLYLFVFFNSTCTRHVSSRRIIRCIGRTRTTKGSRGRVATRLLHHNIAHRRILHVGSGCRGSNITIPNSRTPSRVHGHSITIKRSCRTTRLSSRGTIISRELRDRSTPRTTNVRVFNRGLFRGHGLSFRPDIGLTAPTGCQLKPNSRIVVSV